MYIFSPGIRQKSYLCAHDIQLAPWKHLQISFPEKGNGFCLWIFADERVIPILLVVVHLWAWYISDFWWGFSHRMFFSRTFGCTQRWWHYFWFMARWIMSVYIIIIALLAFMIAKLKQINVCKSKHRGVNMANCESQGFRIATGSYTQFFLKVSLAEVGNPHTFKRQTLPGNSLPQRMWKLHSQHSFWIQSHLGDFAAGIQIASGDRQWEPAAYKARPTLLRAGSCTDGSRSSSPARGCQHGGRWEGWGPVITLHVQ